MAKINKGDFIELEYTGRLKETNEVFDTTDKNTAKETEIYNENMAYGPVIICVGESQILKGLEEELSAEEGGEVKTKWK